MSNRQVISNIIYFAQAGAAVTAGTVSETLKPDIEDDWEKMGCVTKMTATPDRKVERTLCPTADAGYQLAGIDVTEVGLKINGTTRDGSPRLFEQIFMGGSEQIAGNPFIPLSNAELTDGWLHIEQYDNKGVKVNVVDLWGSLALAGGADFENKVAEYQFDFEVYYNVNASGRLYNFAEFA